MKLKLVKIGNSYTVRIPIQTARPFIAGGEIDIRFPETIPDPQKNKKEIINPTQETKWERIAKRYD
jgi:hypothetical protein